MSNSMVRARLLANTLVGFRSALSAAGWTRVGSAKIGGNPVITAPTTATVTEGQATPISGLSFTNSNGATTFVMTVQDTNGLLSATGTGVSGSGTHTLTLSATNSQVNADLQTLTDTDSSLSADTIHLSGSDTFGYDAQPLAIAVTVAACYLRGTMIATPSGERAIESLAIGYPVLTAAGEAEPIRWIGRRAYKTRFARCNPDVAPIRIAANALADGVPSRDLYVSPLHAMFIDGVLVPATDLVNGATISEQPATRDIEYFHIELAEHAVLLANGAPSESFVDDDSRMIFHNAYDYFALYPDAPPRPAIYCAPRISAGEALDAIRRRITSRIVQPAASRAA
jgi:hypothetical protein